MSVPDQENPQGPTAALAAFTAGLSAGDVPTRVRELLTKLVLDWAGVTIGGGAYAESTPAILRAVADQAGQGPGTVAGQAQHYPLRDSAFLNGAFAHSLEFDDTYIPGALHPGAPTVAAALAAAEHRHSTGPELLTALAAGYEVACRVSAALGTGPFAKGFHPTGVAGIFGAVAAAARLEGLDAQHVDWAFGIAGSLGLPVHARHVPHGSYVAEPEERHGDRAVPADLALVGVGGGDPPGGFDVLPVGRVPSRRVRGEPEGDVAPSGGVADALGCDRGTRQREATR